MNHNICKSRIPFCVLVTILASPLLIPAHARTTRINELRKSNVEWIGAKTRMLTAASGSSAAEPLRKQFEATLVDANTRFLEMDALAYHYNYNCSNSNLSICI